MDENTKKTRMDELVQRINEFGKDQESLLSIIAHTFFELRGSVHEDGYQDTEIMQRALEVIEQEVELLREPEKDTTWELE